VPRGFFVLSVDDEEHHKQDKVRLLQALLLKYPLGLAGTDNQVDHKSLLLFYTFFLFRDTALVLVQTLFVFLHKTQFFDIAF